MVVPYSHFGMVAFLFGLRGTSCTTLVCCIYRASEMPIKQFFVAIHASVASVQPFEKYFVCRFRV